jgi:hypothetical protein
VDLEGDVGVVGRLLSDGSDKDRSGLQVDLKVEPGSFYSPSQSMPFDSSNEITKCAW